MERPPSANEPADCDASVFHSHYVRQQDGINRNATVRATERRIIDRLAPLEGGYFLDLGCGTGDDAIGLARVVAPGGRVVGVDSSEAMIAEARKRCDGTDLPVEFHVGDAARLEFADAAFDGCRTERVLQHVADPRMAVLEMVRVAKPGGRIVSCEPDWGTLVIDGLDQSTTRTMQDLRSDQLRHGWIGRQLPGLLKEAGLSDVLVEFMPTPFMDFVTADRALSLRWLAERVVAIGVVSSDASATWLRSLEDASNAGRFFAAITVFLVSGRKPYPVESETTAQGTRPG